MTLLCKKHQILICAVTAVMVGAFFLLRYLPWQRRIRTVRDQIDARESVISKWTTTNEQIEQLQKELLSLRSRVGNYEARIPNHRDLGAFLQKMANLMDRFNLAEQKVQPGQEVEGKEFNCVPVSIKCKGRLQQIFNFLKSLQSLDRLVRIEKLSLVNESDFGGEVSMETKTVIYYSSQRSRG